jgi:hypothetical protein
MGGRSGQSVGRTPIPNLQPQSSGKQWNITSERGDNLTGFTSEELVALTGLPDDFEADVKIRYNDYEATVIIEGKDGVYIKRDIEYENGRIYNAYFEIPKTSKYNGRSLEMFSNQVAEARAQGFDRIEVTAAGEGDGISGARGEFNGYNTWARYGYEHRFGNSERAALRSIKDKTGNEYTSFDQMMRSSQGVKDWRIHGSSFSGTFNLADDSISSKRLIDYQNSK